MKKWKILAITAIIALACIGCGTQEETAAVSPVENASVDEVPTEEAVGERNDNYNDLEEKSENGDATAFAQKIQSAMADKDLEALADLCSYPLAVNGEVIENKEAFLSLDKDTVFSEERCAVIAAVDVQALEETMAGIIMGDATPNIIFQSVDGNLGITGIN